ncbi:MAG: radical SAM protein [Promethearchaeota archaeon]
MKRKIKFILGILLLIITFIIFYTQTGNIKDYGTPLTLVLSILSLLFAFEKPKKWITDIITNAISRLENKACGKNSITSKNIYKQYKNAEDEILIQVSTWPVFGKNEEQALLTSNAKKIVIIGPVKEPYTWMGVLWRFYLLEKRIRNKNTFLLHVNKVPLPMKFIIVDDYVYIALNSDRRTKCYYSEEDPEKKNIVSLKDILFNELFNKGSDALLKLYLDIWEKYKTAPPNNFNNLKKEIIASFKASVREFRDLIGNEHLKLSKDKQRLSNILDQSLKKLINYINEAYGTYCIEINNDKVKWKTNYEFQIAPNIFRTTFEKTIRTAKNMNYAPIGSLPKIRIVITDECNLSCIYCPPGNESFEVPSTFSIMDPEIFNKILKKSYEIGFRKISITGGEPLLALYRESNSLINILKNFLNNNKSLTIYINTNAILPSFKKLLIDLQDYKDQIIFKISLDGILFDNLSTSGEYCKKEFEKFLSNFKKHINIISNNQHENKDLLCNYPKISKSDVIIKNILEALEKGYKIGVNFVLTKDTLPYLKNTVLYIYFLSKNSHNKLYFKILDLNWYRTLGKRIQKEGAVGEAYWLNQYLSPYQIYYQEELNKIFGNLETIINVNSGIQMIETNKIGLKIRIKDSSLGTHYIKPYCYDCIYFITNRCQEGVYQLWVTPNNRLKICYHNPSILNKINDIKNMLFTSLNKEEVEKIFESLTFRNYSK